MATACIAAIDQGTSSSRVLLVASSGRIVSSHQLEHSQHYPTPGQVEHDPLEIFKNVKICLSEAIRKAPIEVEVVAVGITNQRETTVVWNKDTGKPYSYAIVWNDTRTAKVCEGLVDRFGSKDYFREKTGLPIASYFSASKLLYLLSTVPGLREAAESGQALFGTIDTWLMWKLSNGQIHATDVTNGSRTMLMSLQTLTWDETICQELDIPRAMLPTVRPSSAYFGVLDSSSQGSLLDHEVDAELVERYQGLHGVPIHGVIGDQNAALFGQTCFNAGDAKCTYGTGAFLLMNTGTKPVPSAHGLLTTVAYQLAAHPAGTDNHPAHASDNDALRGKAVYALEGSVAYSGSVIQWCRDNLQIIKSAGETEALASSIPDNGGVYFVPAFSGLYAPYWAEDARGLLAGLTAFNTKAHVVRAALEASAFQTIEILQAMGKDCPEVTIKGLKVDGGLTANSLIMQFQSDLLCMPLTKPVVPETTAMGAAFMAGLGVGLWKNFDELHACWKAEAVWQPKMPPAQRNKLIYGWHKALARSMHWRDNATFNASGDLVGDKHYLPDPFLKHLEERMALPKTLPKVKLPHPTAPGVLPVVPVARGGNWRRTAVTLGIGMAMGYALPFVAGAV